MKPTFYTRELYNITNLDIYYNNFVILLELNKPIISNCELMSVIICYRNSYVGSAYEYIDEYKEKSADYFLARTKCMNKDIAKYLNRVYKKNEKCL